MSAHHSLEQLLQELLDHAQVKGSLSNTDLTQLQSALSNVQVEGNLSVGNITQTLLNLIVFIPPSFKPTETPHNLPRSGTIKFVGRAETLDHLKQMLLQSNQVVLAAIEGMGGVGKTELALQYAQLHLLLNTYSGGVCWLRARDEDIGLQIVRFAEAKLGIKPPEDWKLQDQVDFCWSRWHEGNVLLILDDVNDYTKIEPYLPPQPSRFKLLLTTRLQLDIAQSFTLDLLSEAAALELLQEWIGAEKLKQEFSSAQKLCQQLGYLPLALNLVGRYVKKQKISLIEMLRRLEEKKLQHVSLAISRNDPTWTLNVQRGVAAAFELSWEDLSETAKELSCFLSLFALAPIPWVLVENASIKLPFNMSTSHPSSKPLSWIKGLLVTNKSQNKNQDNITLEDARVELENLHLLQGDDPYLLHQLIWEFFKEKLLTAAQNSKLKKAFATTMAASTASIPNAYSITYDLANSLSLTIPHIVEAADTVSSFLSDEEMFDTLNGLGDMYQAQGNYEQAEYWFKTCLSKAQNRLGGVHDYIGSSLNNLAALYYHQSRYAEAIPLLTEAIEIKRKSSDNDNYSLADSLVNLAFMYIETRDYPRAEQFCLQALKLGDKYYNFDRALNALAKLYYVQERYEEAENLLAKALKNNKLKNDELGVSQTLNNLACLYREQERYEEAEPIFLEAIRLRKELRGENNPDTASSLNSLANMYDTQNRYDEAEIFYLKALEIRRNLLRHDNPEVAETLHDLAFLYHRQNRHFEAEPLYIKALDVRRTFLGNRHSDVALTMNNLAKLYFLQERYDEAEPLYLEALEIAKKELGNDHPLTLKYQENLNLLHANVGLKE